MAPLKTLIFMGSTRPVEGQGPIPGRLADRVCKFLVGNMAPNEFEVRVVDPADDDYKLPMLEMPYHHLKFAKQPVSPNLQRLMDNAAWAEAFIFLSPEYNHSVGPALINLVDHITPAAFNGPLTLKPSLIVTYSMGKFGGARAAVQLRSLVAEAGTLVCSSVLSIAEAHIFMDEEGNEIGGQDGSTVITDNFKRAKTELLFVGRALAKERQLGAAAKSQQRKGKL